MKMTAGQEVVKIETKLRQLSGKLDGLVGLGVGMADDAQSEYRKQIDHTKDKCTAVRDKLQRFKDAGGQKWESFRDSVVKAWQDLEEAFKAIRRGPPVPVSVGTEVVRKPEA